MRIARRQGKQRDESGAVILIVLICVVAIFTIVAIVFDIGASLVVKRQMVAAADSSALAAAQSCATGKGSEAAAQANTYANYNRPGATGGIESGNCVTGIGFVTTAYSTQADYNIAPFVGLGNEGSVGARAKAIWGPTESIQGAVPIMLNGNWLGNCNVPDAPIGTQCAFWYDNNATDGSQNSWGFMNLDLWNVSSSAHCSSAGASSRGSWITGGYPGLLTLNYPNPTYVCSDSGHATGNWETDLASTVGQVRSFPVVDQNGQLPAFPATADKYDVVGWTYLKIEAVYKGNDPAAIGSTNTYNCPATGPGYSWSPVTNSVRTLDSFGCFTTTPTTVGAPSITGRLKSSRRNKTFVNGVDYSYDTATHAITWLNTAADVTIKFSYSVTAGGLCPGHTSSPNAVCLVTKWMGTHIGGENPCQSNCTGSNFGATAIRLAE